ncbi:hypothetical protein MNBD_ALPHA06-1601 [hydrothermal vent metagenome]|uniref:Nudix hydrolase domain-containing protein n=1 Tax=hydrothermal vent metagenome TaxID=652676 RepID=A0A3B0S341_9ZZZZ
MKQSQLRDTDPADDKRKGRATRPKLSASLILLRNTNTEVQFLMGKRAASHRFMPGKFVFPGGRVDRADSRAPCASAICPKLLNTMTQQLSRPRALATAAAAIRETYEETGLKLAKPANRTSKAPLAYQAFSSNQLGLDLAALSLLARAITPPYHPKRFDTWFFTAQTDNLIDDPADLASGELEQLQWVTFQQAQSLDLPLITQMVLKDLQSKSQQQNTPTPFYHSRHAKHIREFL